MKEGTGEATERHKKTPRHDCSRVHLPLSQLASGERGRRGIGRKREGVKEGTERHKKAVRTERVTERIRHIEGESDGGRGVKTPCRVQTERETGEDEKRVGCDIWTF